MLRVMNRDFRGLRAIRSLGIKSVRFLSNGAGALDDVHVLDLSRIAAGPFCSMILGDMGATVYKVESVGGGDETRRWPPDVGTPQDGITAYFGSVNRNKRSICVDFKTKEGLEIVRSLAIKCDVLLENFIPGKLDKLGLGYEKMSLANPRLIYCSITGYGNHGPYKDRPGYDNIAAAVGGLMHITGPPGGDPVKVGVAVTDLATGLYAHGAILAALLHRTNTGKGQKIDVNLLSTQVACLINIGSNFLNCGKEAIRWGTQHESIVPYQAFRTIDGYVHLGTGSDAQFQALCGIIGRQELAEDDRFKTNASRVQNRGALIGELEPVFLSKSNDEVLRLLEGAPFPYGPINNMQQVFNDPHVKAIGLVKEVQLQSGSPFKMVGPPVEYSGMDNSIKLPPPVRGQHTVEILSKDLGYSDDKIAQLFKAKVVE
ncbi:unnamed protein product [Nesidiocoris tenuis]|uniref:Succinate--hydroxymethylglutarate CoA-transferase n=1 Tax=Nesidiocoris tenuis TaxID=355587 RepID=A0A6H5HE76_9HEMI|nr:unnamed protein product [Nesidiocoris tenuis]